MRLLEVNMNKRLLVLALVLAAVAVLAVVSSGAASSREGYGVVGLADAAQLFPADTSAPQPYDGLRQSEHGCEGKAQQGYSPADD